MPTEVSEIVTAPARNGQVGINFTNMWNEEYPDDNDDDASLTVTIILRMTIRTTTTMTTHPKVMTMTMMISSQE